MVLCFADFLEKAKKLSVFVGTAVAFTMLSVMISEMDCEFMGMSFAMGLLACLATVGICIVLEKRGKQSSVMTWLSQYTMPIFLMHSIFAATLRSVLLKIGITTAWIHIPVGITISVFGPVITAFIMKKTKYLEFLIYPGKFVKIK